MRRLVWILTTWVVTSAAEGSAQTPTLPQGQDGRLFPPQDLGLLESPDREEWQKPQLILDALGVAEASVVADIGAGGGWFTVRLARRVGPNGIVYAQDVQPETLAAIGKRVRREGLANVRRVLGRGSDPKLPTGVVDAILAVDVLHEVTDRVTFLANLARALRPGGRIGVVEFKAGGGGPGPEAAERVPQDVMEAEAARAGLVLRRRETFLPFQYFLVFSRPAPATTATPVRPGR